MHLNDELLIKFSSYVEVGQSLPAFSIQFCNTNSKKNIKKLIIQQRLWIQSVYLIFYLSLSPIRV